MKHCYAAIILCCTLIYLTACHRHNDNHSHPDEDYHDSYILDDETPCDTAVHRKAVELRELTQKQFAHSIIKTERVALRPFASVIKTSGRLSIPAGGSYIVAATASGVIHYGTQLPREGSYFAAGAHVATLSTQGLPEGDPQSKAKHEYSVAKSNFERAEALLADQLISHQEYEEARLRYENSKTAYLSQAKSATGSGIVLNASKGGYVKQCLAAEGSYVNIGDPIIELTQSNRLELRAELSERHYHALPRIQSARFRTIADGQLFDLEELSGKLVSYGRSAGEGDFFIPIIFEFDNRGNFMPGAYAEVYLISSEKRQTISLPISALTENQGHYFVFIRLDDRHYDRREVKVGDSDGYRVEILSGLQIGEEVVTEGTYRIKSANATQSIPHGHSH